MALTTGEMDAIMGALQHEVPSEHADGSQYIEGAFVAFAVLGQQVAALNDMVSRLKATNANHKHMLNQTDAQNAHIAECYEALQKKHEAVCRERDAWKKEADDERKSMRGALAIMQERAEAAEAKLKEWETAANNSDPYITNGGYVEVEVLEAVKRRNAELLARAEAAEVSINELTARRKPIPLDALLAIEEIAPLIAHDKLSDPAAWMKAWDEVSAWLAHFRA